MERNWKYEGNIGATSWKRNYRGEAIIDTLVLYDLNDDKKAPIMLNCSSCLFSYIDDIEGHDDEERYLRKRFTYDNCLILRKIEVLNRDGKVCKIIEEGDERNWIPKITGPTERIKAYNPEPLSMDAVTNWM